MIKILKLKDEKNKAYSNLKKINTEKHDQISFTLLHIYLKVSLSFSFCFFSHFILLNYFDGMGLFIYSFFILGLFILTFVYLFHVFIKMMNKYKTGELGSFILFSAIGVLSLLLYSFFMYKFSLSTFFLSFEFSIPFLFTMIISFFAGLIVLLERSESKYPDIKVRRSFEDINKALDMAHNKIEKIYQDELEIIKDKDAIYKAVEYIKLEKSSEQDISYIEYILKLMKKNKTNDEKKVDKYNELLGIANENFESENQSDLEIENV